MHPELKQFLRLTLIILGVIAVASLGLLFESINGLAWLIGSPVVVFSALWYRRRTQKRDEESPTS